MDKKKLDEKHLQILNELGARPENRVCCDCGDRGPRWASWNIGCFLCVNCAGIHRRLGTHISKVKSVTLDSWTPEQIESIKSKGNAKVNEQYDPNPERHAPCPKGDDAGLEQFIRNKYERKQFAVSGKFDSGSGSGSGASSGDDRRRYAHELQKLRDMGFENDDANLQALRQTKGDLNAAVSVVVKLPSSKPAAASGNSHVQQALLNSLANMGFKDEKRNLDALKRANGDIDQAVNILVKEAVAHAQNPGQAQMSAPPKAAPKNDLVDLMGDFSAPAPAQTSQPQSHGASSNDFGNFSSAFGDSSQKNDGFGGSNDPFGGGDPFAQNQNKAPPKAKNDILSLYSSAPSSQPGGFGGQPGGFGGQPGGFGGQPGGFGGQPGGFGGQPGGFGGQPGGFGGQPGGFGGQPGGFGGQPGGFGGQPAGFGGQPGGYGGQPGGFGGQPGGFGGQPGGFGGQGGFGGAGGFGGQQAGGFGGQQGGGFGGQQGYGGAQGGGFGGQQGYGGAQGGFGGASNGAHSTNPFGSTPSSPAPSNPFGSSSNQNPFGSAPSQPKSDPFGQLGSLGGQRQGW